MTCDRCVWGRWIQGRHRKHWFRFCKRCGQSARSETQPEQVDESRPLKWDTAKQDVSPRIEIAEDLRAGFDRPPQKFTVAGAREGVRQERAKLKGKP
jgi:hypothetical protein